MCLLEFSNTMKIRKLIHSDPASLNSGELVLTMALTGAGFKLSSSDKYKQAKIFIGCISTFVKLNGDLLNIETININLPYPTSEFRKALEASGFHRALLGTGYEFRVPKDWFAPPYTRYL